MTATSNKWYIFVPPEHTGPVALKNVSKPASATLMGGEQPVAAKFADGARVLTLPTEQRNKLTDVIVVQWA